MNFFPFVNFSSRVQHGYNNLEYENLEYFNSISYFMFFVTEANDKIQLNEKFQKWKSRNRYGVWYPVILYN